MSEAVTWEDVAHMMQRVRDDPFGLSAQQRAQSEIAGMFDGLASKWDGQIHYDGRGEPFISLDGTAVRLPPTLAALFNALE